MPKLKTNRAARKRFSFSKNGKVKHKRAYLRHLLSSKSPGRKRRLRHSGILDRTEAEVVKKLMPYA
jgi:large subunit ribosomal protein L35